MQIIANIKYSKSSQKLTRKRQHNGEKLAKKYNQAIHVRTNLKRQYMKKDSNSVYPENANQSSNKLLLYTHQTGK